ncbi:unnamed protein product [Ixodes pacificus]
MDALFPGRIIDGSTATSIGRNRSRPGAGFAGPRIADGARRRARRANNASPLSPRPLHPLSDSGAHGRCSSPRQTWPPDTGAVNVSTSSANKGAVRHATREERRRLPLQLAERAGGWHHRRGVRARFARRAGGRLSEPARERGRRGGRLTAVARGGGTRALFQSRDVPCEDTTKGPGAASGLAIHPGRGWRIPKATDENLFRPTESREQRGTERPPTHPSGDPESQTHPRKNPGASTSPCRTKGNPGGGQVRRKHTGTQGPVRAGDGIARATHLWGPRAADGAAWAAGSSLGSGLPAKPEKPVSWSSAMAANLFGGSARRQPAMRPFRSPADDGPARRRRTAGAGRALALDVGARSDTCRRHLGRQVRPPRRHHPSRGGARVPRPRRSPDEESARRAPVRAAAAQ